MRNYIVHKRFIPYVERVIDADQLTTQLCNYLTLKSLGATDEMASKTFSMDMTYIYTKLIYGDMLLTSKESFYRLKRLKYFTQSSDTLTFKPTSMLNADDIAPKIDFNTVKLPTDTHKPFTMEEVIKTMEKLIEEVQVQKLQELDDKKLRAMKDVLTNFRLLLKKLGFIEQKTGSVSTLSKDNVTIIIDSDGLTSNKELFVISTSQCAIKLK
jgi:hypothetical protein